MDGGPLLDLLVLLPQLLHPLLVLFLLFLLPRTILPHRIIVYLPFPPVTEQDKSETELFTLKQSEPNQCYCSKKLNGGDIYDKCLSLPHLTLRREKGLAPMHYN